jgi:hypothetical protein
VVEVVDSSCRQFLTACDVVAWYHEFVAGRRFGQKGESLFGSATALAVAARLLGHASNYIT